jgi:pyruvate kinase
MGEQTRKTKIIATLGPATESADMVRKMISGGMNIVRLNMSHAPHDWVRRVVGEIRKAANELGAAVGIMMDTQGPAIRTGDLPVPLNLKPGEKFALTVRGEKSEEEHSVDVNYENFVNDINVGDIVLLDNGQIHMRVLAKKRNVVECEVLTPGILGSRRHINLPGVKVSLPALTAKDLRDVELGLELGVDFFALSFVREPKDILQLQAVISKSGRVPLVIAKIEDQQAVRNMHEIIEVADGIMIARGDLGIEIPYEELPIVQRKIVKLCHRVGKPVIVATHMLESMIENPLPTRAEVTDVANAVFEQADAIMLSGETTVGKYPLKCLEVFNRIACRIERSGGANYEQTAELRTPRHKLVKSAIVMAEELKAQAIVVFTVKGHMARYASWLRPKYSPIFAICENQDMACTLTLCRAVTPVVVKRNDAQQPEESIQAALQTLVKRGLLEKGDTVVIISSIEALRAVSDAVQMRVV